MRPRFVAVVLLLAFCLLGATVFVSRSFLNGMRSEPLESLPPLQKQSEKEDGKVIPEPVQQVVENRKEPVSVPQVISKANHPNKDPEYVQKRIAELTALAMKNDVNSFAVIWSELSNQDKEIRAAALEAVVQFGDRSAVPRLREFAGQVEDPFEKVSILTAAEHLELPSP